MAYSGKYLPKNKQKYRGDVSKITYRSNWEKFVMNHLDLNPHVKAWSSEETVIPYFSEAENKKRRYFVDFTVWYNDGTIHLWEVKPAKETKPPKAPSRMTSKSKARYAQEVYTFHTNICKWKAATSICVKKGWKFKIITEQTLQKYFGMKL